MACTLPRPSAVAITRTHTRLLLRALPPVPVPSSPSPPQVPALRCGRVGADEAEIGPGKGADDHHVPLQRAPGHALLLHVLRRARRRLAQQLQGTREEGRAKRDEPHVHSPAPGEWVRVPIEDGAADQKTSVARPLRQRVSPIRISPVFRAACQRRPSPHTHTHAHTHTHILATLSLVPLDHFKITPSRSPVLGP